MANLDQQKNYNEFKEKVLVGIQQHFPIKGSLQTLELEKLDVADEKYDPDSIREQHKAKVEGDTWAAPVYGSFVLKDNKTGETLDKKRLRIADIPLITSRFSHIIDGKEYQVNNQWQLKPGVYAKRRVNGELEAAFQIPTKRSFDVTFDPDSKLFLMDRGGSKIPMYPLMKQLGVDDSTLEHSWGKEIFALNKAAKGSDTALSRFFKVDKKRQPKDNAEATQYLIDTMAASQLRPDATELTLGKKFSNVTGEALHIATSKLLKIQAGAPEDDRDSILFKDLRSVGDFAYDYLTHYETKKSVRDKVIRKMFSAKDVRDLVKYDMFNDSLRRTFHENSEAELAKQINPVEMLGLAQQTTVLGPGGIQSQNAFDNMATAKFVNPSTLGYLDAVRTPESEKSGGILRMPLGTVKVGKEPAIPLFNLKTQKMELVVPSVFHKSTVLLPDQVTWDGGKPKPKTTALKASVAGNTMEDVSWKEADYVFRHASQLFSATTNLIPFLGNNSGNRATYAGQHIEQSISLKHREPPLVQVATTSTKKGESTFEEIVGGFAAHSTPVAGTISAISKDAITVKQDNGKHHEVQIYNNFPLNDPKAMLHSTPTVKVGDKVAVGQNVADSNYTKGGALALGTTLRVGYIPLRGYNYEDGLVISKSAAEKLTSEHMHKPQAEIAKDTILNPKKFIVQHPDVYSAGQYSKLDDAGVVKVGQKVKAGDPLVLSMRPYQAKDKLSLQAVGRALSGAHQDTSLKWSADNEGTVVGVHRDKDKITVHVRTEERMQVGDKLSNRHGGKGICVAVLDDDKMPHTRDGKHIEVAFNPLSIPGRMNLGQVLETAAGKIAEKTGKTYVVHNFSGEDQRTKIKGELSKLGLSDKEELFDPVTNTHIGKALVGPQHMFKLVHQIDKKESARSGMALPGSDPESYDNNLMPASGGHSGGQALGALDLYVLLAHGAKNILREAQTIKSEGPDPNPNPAKRWDSQHQSVWNAIQLGEPIPPPKTTFAWQKFTDMLKASGIDVVKKGHQLQLLPLTDKQILKMSNGEITKPGEVVYPSLNKDGEPKPKTGGLFDEKVTGGHGGKAFSHVALPEPLPNPVFERPIQRLTGLTENQYFDVVHGKKAVTGKGELVALGTANAVTGGTAIVNMLKGIDVEKELKSSEKQLLSMRLPSDLQHRKSTPVLDGLVKKVKYLRALKDADLKPEDAYVLHNLPILPPIMRPISMLSSGSIKWGDMNELYKHFGAVVTAMKDSSQQKLGDEHKQELRQSLYEGARAIVGVGTPQKDQEHRGILQQIAGKIPKEGYFQQTLMARRQDMSMRSTIVPEPSLSLDEVGLPRDKALILYKPFVIRKLVEIGAAPHVLDARKLVQKPDASVFRALELVAAERPVLIKRDPALHKHSIQAFKPKIVTGKAIKIHPLVTGGFSADFDGDSCDLDTHIPLRIKGKVCLKTGRELLVLLDAADGNYVATVKDIEAYTYTGWKPVKTVSFHDVSSKKKYRIELKNGQSFIVSEDHSLMVQHKEVKPTHLVAGTALDFTRVQPEEVNAPWSYDQGVAYGNFLGDGCAEIRRQGGGRVSIACLPLEERNYLMRIWRANFLKANPSQYKFGFHVNGVDLAKHFLDVCGRYSDGKYVGDALLNKGSEFLKGLLAGYINSDGSVELTKSGSYLVRTWSRSKKLRDGMSFVALMLGLPHSIRERTAKGKVNYLISFGKEAIKLLDYRCDGKKKRLLEQARAEYAFNRNDDRRSQSLRGFEVKHIQEVEYADRMIDIEVDDPQHVFTLVSGVVVHNTMSAYVPITNEAVAEARKMFPSNNLYSEASGRVVHSPTLESALGLYKLSRVEGSTDKKFASPVDAIAQVNAGKLTVNQVASIDGVQTTVGRVLLASAMPKAMQDTWLKDHSKLIDKKGLDSIFSMLAANHREEYGVVSNRLKDLGNGAASGAVPIHAGLSGTDLIKAAEGKGLKYVAMPVHSLGLDDFAPDTATRDPIVRAAQREVDAIKDSTHIPSKDKERRVIDVWIAATAKMNKEHLAKIKDNPTALAGMLQAGTKPGMGQYQQMVLAPILMADATGKPIATPIVKSYAEGLDVASYWTQQQGARRGTVMKVQEVRDPGTLSKRMVQTTMGLVVAEEDCGTTKGISLALGSKDVQDRVLANDISIKDAHYTAGTRLTSGVLDQLRAADKNGSVVVRSPLKCEHAKGLCRKCAGLRADGNFQEIGANVGILAAQALGERSVQLTMKQFHMGGLVQQSGGSKAVDDFGRVEQLLQLTEHIPNEATLSMRSGKIERVEKDSTGAKVWVGGVQHHVGKDRSGMDLHIELPLESKSAGYSPWQPPHVGMHVDAGTPLSDPNRTVINPRDLYKATNNMERVQNYMVDELHRIYGGDVKRHHVETLVHAMGNLTKVRHPGDDPTALVGEFRPVNQIRAINRELVKAGKNPIEHSPVLKGVENMPLEVQEDWLAKLQHVKLRGSLLDSVATGAYADPHGLHPVAGLSIGSEFGLNETHSLRPGLGHLKNVNKANY